jgi:hypothetical protein
VKGKTSPAVAAVRTTVKRLLTPTVSPQAGRGESYSAGGRRGSIVSILVLSLPAATSSLMKIIMQAVSGYACAIVVAAMMASASGAHAQDERLKVPKVIVMAQAAPVEPPYTRSLEVLRAKSLFRSLPRRGR